MAKKRRSYPKSANKWKFDAKDKSIIKIQWNSPIDKKENTIDIKTEKENYTIKIKDNH